MICHQTTKTENRNTCCRAQLQKTKPTNEDMLEQPKPIGTSNGTSNYKSNCTSSSTSGDTSNRWNATPNEHARTNEARVRMCEAPSPSAVPKIRPQVPSPSAVDVDAEISSESAVPKCRPQAPSKSAIPKCSLKCCRWGWHCTILIYSPKVPSPSAV